MLHEKLVQSKDELIASLRTMKCDCGYKVTDDDTCFDVQDGVIIFECPGCGATWTARPFEVN